MESKVCALCVCVCSSGVSCTVLCVAAGRIRQTRNGDFVTAVVTVAEVCWTFHSLTLSHALSRSLSPSLSLSLSPPHSLSLSLPQSLPVVPVLCL
jgi:hypothetical protein